MIRRNSDGPTLLYIDHDGAIRDEYEIERVLEPMIEAAEEAAKGK